MTKADQIRSMTDEELSDAIYRLTRAGDVDTWFCKYSEECGKILDADGDIPDEMCKKCLLKKLQEPAEDIKSVTMADEDKLHAGLIEEE